MKFEFEIECKLDTDSKNKSEFANKFKKKAIKFAGKALDVAVTAINAVGEAVDNAADALLEAEIALEDEVLDSDLKDDEDDEDDEEDEDDIIKEDLKEYTFWAYLDKISDYTIDSSFKTIDCEKEVEKFLRSIDFEPNECTLKAFEIAVTLKKITYDNVITKVSEYYPVLTAEDIKDLFIDDFIHWLTNKRPDVDENCKNANFMLLVRYFVKKVRAL